MKKSTIWLIASIMGISFLTLFYLQTRYFEEVYDMRMVQFNESVKRSLYEAARKIELDETQERIEKAFKREDSQSKEIKPTASEKARLQEIQLHRHLSMPVINKYQEKRKIINKELRDTIQYYLYKKDMMDEVFYAILYKPSDLPLQERVNFKKLDRNLKVALKNNGIDLTYHFRVGLNSHNTSICCLD